MRSIISCILHRWGLGPPGHPSRETGNRADPPSQPNKLRVAAARYSSTLRGVPEAREVMEYSPAEHEDVVE